MPAPDISIVIPVHNRAGLVRHALDSVKTASEGLDVEIVVVDDGSDIPLEDELGQRRSLAAKLIRQERSGLLFARLAGLRNASGRNVMFLDSDDLISQDKLRSHVETLEAADVSYSDMARQRLDIERGPLGICESEEPLPATNDPAEFFLRLQPAPHSPAFRTSYLQNRISNAPFPPSPLYNPVAEIWFYHICAPFPARIKKSSGLAIICSHGDERLTGSWERIGVASLAVQEAFARTYPSTPEGKRALEVFAAKAFGAWRRLPYDFSPEFSDRLLELFKSSMQGANVPRLGGPLFRLASAALGPVRAGRLFKRFQSQSYANARTIDAATFQQLMAELPRP